MLALLKLPKKQKSSHQGFTQQLKQQVQSITYAGKADFHNIAVKPSVKVWLQNKLQTNNGGVQVLCNGEVMAPGLPASPDCEAASTPMAIAALTAMGMAHAHSSRTSTR